jgi:hypothetical protein
MSGARGQIILSSLPSRYTFQDPQGFPVRSWLGSVLAFQRSPSSPDLATSLMLNVVGQLTSAALDISRNDVADRAVGKSHS